jgi:hypothetical protein
MPSIFAANESSVLVDGEAVEGIRAIEYRQQRTRSGVYALGSAERIGIVSGPQSVEGRLRVASTSQKLDGLDPEVAFQISAQLRHGEQTMTVTFDECFMLSKGFEMGVGSHGEAEYSFTATRVREAMG